MLTDELKTKFKKLQAAEKIIRSIVWRPILKNGKLVGKKKV